MRRAPNIQQHPNQESKSGRAPYASPVKRNASTNDPLQDEVVGGVEEKMRKQLEKSSKRQNHGKGKISGKRRPDTDR